MNKYSNFFGLILSISGFGYYISKGDVEHMMVYSLLITVFLNLVPTKEKK